MEPLLNLKQLAKALGVGYSFARAMHNAGLETPGGRVTESAARRWLKQHPAFKVSENLKRKETL